MRRRTLFVNRKMVSATMLTLLLTSMLMLAFKIQPAKAEGGTIYIRADGSIDPPIAPISTIDNVTYTFTDNTNDSIVVERDNIAVDGAGYTMTGSGSEDGMTLTGRSNVTVRNMTIKNFNFGIRLDSSSNNVLSDNNITANSGRGIYLYSSSNSSVSGNNITANNWEGIRLDSSSNYNSVFGNTITNNCDGISLLDSSGNSISGNNIANNAYGIWLYSSSNSSISGNTFTNDALNVQDSYQNSVENNTVNGRPLVYLEGVSNYTVDDAGQVILVRCEGIRVEGLNLSRTDIGVELWETGNSTIFGNNIANNAYGIGLYYSSNYNSIFGNNIANNGDGIYLDYSSNSTISGNNIANNYYYGILLWDSSGNSISGNTIANNGNTIANNGGWGVISYYSSDNRIFHNNFISNFEQADSESSIDVWDDGYPSGGNYWSNYTGVDLCSGPYQNETGSDGIGDTEYAIAVNNTDKYPLMKPYVLGDLDRDGDVDEDDLWHFCGAFIDYYKMHVLDPNCDFDSNSKIDEDDLWTFCGAFIDYWKQH